MELWRVAYGAIGSLLTGMMVIYGLRVIHHFEAHKEVAATGFFIRDGSVRGFKVLIYGLITYSSVTAMILVGVIPEGILAEVVITVLYMSITYFMYIADRVTTRQPRQ